MILEVTSRRAYLLEVSSFWSWHVPANDISRSKIDTAEKVIFFVFVKKNYWNLRKWKNTLGIFSFDIFDFFKSSKHNLRNENLSRVENT